MGNYNTRFVVKQGLKKAPNHDPITTSVWGEGMKFLKIFVPCFVGLLIVIGTISFLASRNYQGTSPPIGVLSPIAKAESAIGSAMGDPQKVKLLECTGIQVYLDPQPPGHPPSAADCAKLLKQTDIASPKNKNDLASVLNGLPEVPPDKVAASPDELWHVGPAEVYDPATYCNWNRTGLPAAQQTICANRHTAITVRMSTPNIKAFLDATAPAQRNMTLATWAVMCGLRSEGWLDPLTTSYQQYMRETANRFHIGNDGLDAADMQAKTITTQLRSEVTCKTLVNSEMMEQLDGIQNHITGGYR